MSYESFPTTSSERRGISSEAMERLGAYCWPGDPSQSVIRLAILMPPCVGRPENLTDELLASQDDHLQNGNTTGGNATDQYVTLIQQRIDAEQISSATLELMERKLIPRFLVDPPQSIQSRPEDGITRGACATKTRSLGIVIPRRVDRVNQ